ncbi:MAG TPA: GTP-binding protein, partial [Actinopolymorphaceae bacterium]
MPTLNLGILAHVDAGKTSLTERLLFDTGTIGRLGSVDAGDTQTDTGDLERQRGITIRTAVASFAVDDLQVNLIDTPGHSDFIAEVERALAVLDGAVLVISAVEGVQPQTRVLMRTLRRLGIPTTFFVNKADRMGARDDDLLAEIRRKLSVRIVALNTVDGIGTADVRTTPVSLAERTCRSASAEILAEDDDGMLADLVDGTVPSRGRVEEAIAAQTARARLHPVFFGSALSGVGVADLLAGVRSYLPPAREDEKALHGRVFAIRRGRTGEKLVYLRLYGGQ